LALNELMTPAEANTLIARGHVLHMAGDERALRQLARGTWIGGTTPYILTRGGGVVERDKVFVSELPVKPGAVAIHFIDIGRIPAITTEAPRNGFTIVIAPGMSEIHTILGLTANAIPGIRDIAVIGWVSGVHADDHARVTAKVFNGLTGEACDDRIVVLQAPLPPDREAVVGIVNLIRPGSGDAIVFDAPSFSVKECTINGVREDFYTYAVARALPLHCPLVTDLNGEHISVSLKELDAQSRSVKFFAPVMRGRVYRQADVVPDYREALVRFAALQKLDPVLSCNCYNNYAYNGLEGAAFNPLPGPAVFGELAHVLMNQTLVCLSIKAK
jgi:hypothetical protein